MFVFTMNNEQSGTTQSTRPGREERAARGGSRRCPGRAKHGIISSHLKSEKQLVKIQRKEFESIKMCDASTIGFVTFYLLELEEFESTRHYQ